MKTVLVEVYIRYKTILLHPDRTRKRSWEGADFMAEVGFERILAGERAICKASHTASIRPRVLRVQSQLVGSGARGKD